MAKYHEIDCPECNGWGECQMDTNSPVALEPTMGPCEYCNGFGRVMEEAEPWFDTVEEARGER